MDKIQESLKLQCLADLKSPIKVIVTGFVAPEKAMQMSLKPINGLDNIFSGSLTGEDILAIEQLETIERIEFDSDMGIL